MKARSTLAALALALPLAIACSSDEQPGGGGLDQALGSEMSELSALGDRFVGENQATYDGLDQAADAIGTALQNPLPSEFVTKQAGCLPASLAGQAFDYDPPSNTFVPASEPGPADAVQFNLFSDPQTPLGYVSVTCAGVLPGPINVVVSVNTADDVEVMNLAASVLSIFPPSSFNATLAGTLRSSDGQDEIPFGVGFDNSFGLDELSKFASVGFLIDDTITASVSQSVFLDPSFPSEEIMITVQDTPDFNFEFICPSLFYYQAIMRGTPDSVSGGGLFCARPPLADDFNYFVNCDNGSIDDMVVSAANVSCQANIDFVGDPTPVSGGVLQDIQGGTNAILGMFNAVVGVAGAGAAVGLEVAAQQQLQ